VVSLFIAELVICEKYKYRNFSVMKRISATYRIFKSGVKLQARKMRLWGKKKGKSLALDSPF